MADRKITDMSALAAGSQATGDLIAVVDVSEAAAVNKNKKMTMENLFKGIPGDVGIGTASPSRQFQVENSSGNAIAAIVSGTSSSSFLLLGDTADDNIGQIGYSNTDNALFFDTNGSERARIDSSGNVGVGTSAPNAGLNVGLGAGNVPAAGAATASALFGNALGANAYGLAVGATSGGNGYIQAQRADGTATTYDLYLQPNGGNVGIGTTSVDSELHISKADVTPKITLQRTGSATSKYSIGAGGGALTFYDEADAREAFRVDTDGRFLVGTSSARSNYSGITPYFQFEHGSGNDQRSFAITHNGTNTAGPILFVGKSRGSTVGSNTVVASGDELGQITFNGADGTNMIQAAKIIAEVDGTPGTNDMPGRLVFSTTADGSSSPTERMRIDSQGRVYVKDSIILETVGKRLFFDNATAASIGSSSSGASTTTLYIGNAAIQVSSDARLKKDVEPTSLDALDAIRKISVKDFAWNDPTDTSYNNRNARGKWTGLIAQELVEILPFVVNAPRKEEDGSIDYESEARWTLDQSQLCPVLIKAIQQQQDIIAGLEARLSALEAS